MSQSEGDGHGLPGGRKAAVAVVLAVLVAIGVALLIGRAAGFASVRDEISAADERWFVVCFLAEVAAFGAYAVVLRYAIRRPSGPELGFGLSLHLTLASLGATRVIAAAGAGGLAVTFWFFRRAGHATGEAVVRVRRSASSAKRRRASPCPGW
jgi:hypothetical protein